MSSFRAILLITLLTALFTEAPAQNRQGITKIGYAIQVGAFMNVQNAEKLTNKLQEKGIDAFYFKKNDGLFAVRFGDFKTWDDAKHSADKLVSSKIIDKYYIAPPTTFGKTKKTTAAEPKATKKKTGNDDEMGEVAAQTAERFIGIPYLWGGNTVMEGLDCSGFSKAVYHLCGVSIPRTAREQFTTGSPVTMKKLKRGDLVFFGKSEKNITHVGIYAGKGTMVHAPGRGKKIRKADITKGELYKKFMGGRRYF